MDSVYMPAEDSYLFLELINSLPKTEDGRRKTALDMGTGSGILAIALAKKGYEVTAADINPEAIKLAEKNAKKECEKIKFVLSDLFENIDERFDLIVFNTPYVPTEDSETEDLRSAAWDGGKDGLEVTREFLSHMRDFIRPKGKAIILVSSNSEDPPQFEGFKQKVLSKQSYLFERLFLLQLS